jgi:hypothetical protein
MRRYMIANGAMSVKYLLKHPNFCRPLYWDLKHILKEIVTGKNTYLPEIGFSHRNKLACIARGAGRYFFMRKDHSARRLWDEERDRALFSSPATRKIEALEAQGYRLHHREGDEYHFVKER